MPQTFVLPKQVGFIGGAVAPASVLRFYQTGTSTPQNVYTDAALTAAVTSITADSAGVFAKVYLNPSASANYRITLENSLGVVSYTEDDIAKNPLTQASVGETLFPRTTAESAASVTPSNYAYQPGDLRRYGATIDGTTDDSTAFQRAIDVSEAGGGPVLVPAGSIKISSGLVIDTDGVEIIGAARGKSIIKAGTGSLVMLRVAASYCNVSMLKFDGNAQSSVTA